MAREMLSDLLAFERQPSKSVEIFLRSGHLACDDKESCRRAMHAGAVAL